MFNRQEEADRWDGLAKLAEEVGGGGEGLERESGGSVYPSFLFPSFFLSLFLSFFLPPLVE